MEENINIENEYVEETPAVQEVPLVTPAYEMAQEPKKKKKNLKAWLIAGIGALVAIAAVVLVLVFFVFNTYKTPIKLMEKANNAKKASAMYDRYIKMLNGFCEDEFQEYMEIIKKSESSDDIMGDFAETIEDNEEEFGDNYKIKYKIVEKEKIDKEDLKELQDGIRDSAKEWLSENEDVDYEEVAYYEDLTVAQAKKLVKAQNGIAKILKKVKVSAGYTLTVNVTIRGSELDEPEEEEMEINVYKINGRWVSDYALMMLGTAL